MSGYPPGPQKIAPTAATLSMPIKMFHGDSDPMVRLEWAEMSFKAVKDLGFTSVRAMISCACAYLLVRMCAYVLVRMCTRECVGL
jgi:hypothetical protein